MGQGWDMVSVNEELQARDAVIQEGFNPPGIAQPPSPQGIPASGHPPPAMRALPQAKPPPPSLAPLAPPGLEGPSAAATSVPASGHPLPLCKVPPLKAPPAKKAPPAAGQPVTEMTEQKEEMLEQRVEMLEQKVKDMERILDKVQCRQRSSPCSSACGP